MSDTATLETPQEAIGTNGQAQEAAPQVTGESPVSTDAPTEPAQADPAQADASMNWPEQKPAEQITREQEAAARASDPAEEPIGSKGAVEGDPPDKKHWKMILAAREQQTKAEKEVESAAEVHKDAKKRLKKAAARVVKLIDELRFPGLFTGQKTKPEPIENAKAPETASEAGKPTQNITENITAATDDAWRAVPLADLGIKATTLKILADHTPSLTTMGELCDWQEKKGDFWAKDISGVGPTKRSEIEDAQLAHWQKHPLPQLTKAEPISKAPDMPGDLPSAPPARKLKTLADLGLTTDQIEAAYYPALLAKSKGDKPVDCPDVVRPTLDGGKTLVDWIVVPGPMGGADYMLVPLLQTKHDEFADTNHGNYWGILVTHKGQRFWLGSAEQSLLLSSPKARGESDAKLTRGAAKAAKMESVLA